VGTAKRERQKANRQLRLQEIAKEARKQKSKRVALRIGLGVALLVAVVGVVYLVNRGSDNGTATGATTTVVPSTDAPSTTAPISLPSTVPGVTIPAGTATPCPKADGSSPRTTGFSAAPTMCIDASKTYTAKVVTNKGEFTITLDAKKAPNTVNNFVVLSRYHFYDGIVCHRILQDFMAQCGDPTGTGGGGPGYTFKDELPAAPGYQPATVAMANSGPDTNGSQFFVVTGSHGASLPASYSIFGQVTAGFDTTVKAIEAAAGPNAGDGVPTKETIILQSITITES
jgi:cyclophilin family peptidyl-prolyl cis-trans isomerase